MDYQHDTSAAAVYGEMGFRLEQQGGGATAFQRRNPADGTFILITVQDDSYAPTDAAEPVLVGLYADDYEHGGRCLAYFYAPDSDAVKFNMAHGRWTVADAQGGMTQ